MQFATVPLLLRRYGFLQREKRNSGVSAAAITELVYPLNITSAFLSLSSGCTAKRFRVVELAWRCAGRLWSVTAAGFGSNRLLVKDRRSSSRFLPLTILT